MGFCLSHEDDCSFIASTCVILRNTCLRLEDLVDEHDYISWKNDLQSIREFVSSQSHPGKCEGDALLAFVLSNAYTDSKEVVTGWAEIR